MELLSLNQTISKLPSPEGVTVLKQGSFLQDFLKDTSIAVDKLDELARLFICSLRWENYLSGKFYLYYLDDE